jgi:hypothetical protein
MFHFQEPTIDWPRAIAKLPAGYVIKAIDNVQMLSDVKATNPGLKTNLRHYYQNQSPAATFAENKNSARYFFSTFIDDTFKDHAHNVDYIEEWNEYYGNTQSATERQRFIEWSRAAAWVWENEYRTQPVLAHIKLILANTAIGNDIPIEVAFAAHNHGAIVGYHPYWPTLNNQILINEWPWYSGRWTAMDSYYRSEGLHVEWALTEAGSVRYWDDGGGVSLDPNGGWKHELVHNSSITHYKNAIKYFMDRWHAWNEDHGWRAQSIVLFNSHNNPDSAWRSFNIVQPEMDEIAEFINSWVPGAPTPPTPVCTGEPREQDFRVYNVIPPTYTKEQAEKVFEIARSNSLETVGWSYDDDGIGKLDNKIARLWGILDVEKQTFIDWYIHNYPCTTVEFAYLPN